MLLFLFFLLALLEGQPAGIVAQHKQPAGLVSEGRYCCQAIRWLPLPSLLQINIIYAKKCVHTCIVLPDGKIGKRIFLAFLITSKDVSAFQLRECLHEWVIKCQAGLEE